MDEPGSVRTVEDGTLVPGSGIYHRNLGNQGGGDNTTYTGRRSKQGGDKTTYTGRGSEQGGDKTTLTGRGSEQGGDQTTHTTGRGSEQSGDKTTHTTGRRSEQSGDKTTHTTGRGSEQGELQGLRSGQRPEQPNTWSRDIQLRYQTEAVPGPRSNIQYSAGSDIQMRRGLDIKKTLGSDVNYQNSDGCRDDLYRVDPDMARSMVGSDIHPQLGASSLCRGGSDMQSITGSYVQSQVGSDVRSQVGSDLQSQAGPDTRSRRGSGASQGSEQEWAGDADIQAILIDFQVG